MSLPFVDLQAQFARLEADVRRNMDAVLAHGKYIMGPEVAESERQLAAFAGVDHCLTCASGTDALVMALLALGIGPGHAVITVPFTFIATVEAIALVGATPVFVDVDPRTFNMDTAKLEQVLDQLSETHPGVAAKAIMPVDLFGLSADYDAINALAQKHGLDVIGDAAQSFGADYKGKKAVACCRVACTSFFPAKPLGCYGDGGAVFTRDAGLHDVMASVRVHGTGTQMYHHDRLGINGRFDSLQAAVILAKLPVYSQEIAARRAVADRYNAGFASLDGKLVTPLVPDGYGSVYAQYSVLLGGDSGQAEKRDTLRANLSAKGIPTAVYYPLPNHLQPVFAHLGHGPGSMPVTEDLAERIFSLPMHAYLTPGDQDRIIAAVVEALS